MNILERPVPGYNNVLTVATDRIKFGLNDDVNQLEQPITLALPPKRKRLANLTYRM